MREILFRGKRVDGELWVEGSLVNNIFFRAESNRPIPYIIDPHEYESYDCMEDIGDLAVEVIPETVGQFTGRLDKNSREIYEGDIVRIEDSSNAIIEYSNLEAMFIFNFIGKWKTYGTWDTARKDIEIIGNIHDNKMEEFK